MSGKITSKIARHVHVEKGHGPLLGIVVSLRHKRSHQVVLNFKYMSNLHPLQVQSCEILLHPVREH